VIHAIPAFNDNYIWIIGPANSDAQKRGPAVVVDPGDAQPVIRFMDEHGLALAAILITHHHGDHAGGIAGLLQYAPRFAELRSIPVYGPADEPIANVTTPLRQGDTVEIAATQSRFSVIDVPGHTRGHIAYYGHCGSFGPVVFCGDTLFAGGCGRIFEGTAEQMWDSLEKLSALPPETLVYCAHEYTLSNMKFAHHALPEHHAIAMRYEEVVALRQRNERTVPSTIGLERNTNPFLQCANAKAFARMRQQKDEFRG